MIGYKKGEGPNPPIRGISFVRSKRNDILGIILGATLGVGLAWNKSPLYYQIQSVYEYKTLNSST